MQIREVSLFRQILGAILILIGIAGIILPILPGWLLIFVGLELVGLQLVFFEKIKSFVKSKIEGAKKK
jgi:uncharacterized protein YqgC (DUF456 family)